MVVVRGGCWCGGWRPGRRRAAASQSRSRWSAAGRAGRRSGARRVRAGWLQSARRELACRLARPAQARPSSAIAADAEQAPYFNQHVAVVPLPHGCAPHLSDRGNRPAIPMPCGRRSPPPGSFLSLIGIKCSRRRRLGLGSRARSCRKAAPSGQKARPRMGRLCARTARARAFGSKQAQ